MNNQNTRILVVDDEETICFFMKANLELDGYDVDIAFSAEEAMLLDLTQYSLIMLDVMMGEVSGYDLAQQLHNNEATRHIPVILCTAKSDEDDVIKGYNCGIDDYIRKPFSVKEMILRVRNVLRRASVNNNIITFSSLVINASTKRCYINGIEVVLTRREFELLLLLYNNIGCYFSREDILKRLWDNDGKVVDRTVDVNINRLRKKLGVLGQHITTKTGFGYGFEKNI